MTNEDFRVALAKREQTLLDEMEKNRAEALDTDLTASEPMERMVNLEGRDALLRHNDTDSGELIEVRAALDRLDQGTFGKCVECGRDIPPARLEAIPWTSYCLEDQQKHEHGGSQSSIILTL